MKVAVLGLGSIGMRHTRNLRRLGVTDLVGMDPDEIRRSHFTAETGAPTRPTLETMLTEGPFDLALICSPNRFHLEQAKQLCGRGIALFVEKPLSTNSDGVAELIDAIAAAGLFAHYGSNWKFHPAFRKMKQLLDDGAIGTVTGAQILAGQWLPDWHPWEDYRNGYSARTDLGGGVVFDSHELDYVTWLLGPAESICGYTTNSGVLEIDTADTAVAALKLRSGALVSLQLDYIQREARRRYHLAGSRGTIEWDLSKETVSAYEAETATWTLYPAALGDINEMYLEQTRHILEGAQGDADPITPLSDAAAVLDLQIQLMDTFGNET